MSDSTSRAPVSVRTKTIGRSVIRKPVAAHIHSGVRGQNGSVVVTLKQPSTGNGGVSAACVNSTRAIVSAIKASPAKFYVNVHTADFPGGAIRGQLAAR